jgi:hypothetical protein
MSDNKINAKDFELKEENKDNFRQSVIERKNVVTEFTVEVVEEHKNDLLKFERELESQISLCQKTIDNMLKNHEWLKDLDDEKLHHAWMMKSNADVIAEAVPKLEEVKNQLAQYNDLLDTVYEKFGFVKSEVATPAVDPGHE